jgi:hypothetical protein
MQIKTGNSETLTTLDIHKSGVYIYIYILYRQIKTGKSETLTTLDIHKSGYTPDLCMSNVVSVSELPVLICLCNIYIYIYTPDLCMSNVVSVSELQLTTLDIDKSGIHKYIYIVQLVMNHSYIS